MKLAENNVKVTGNFEFTRSWTAQIPPEAQKKMIEAVTKGLYSDPYTAVLREYTSNAIDAHTKAGQTRPVEVFLPTPLSPNLIVQDWGTGISADDLVGFTNFGVSDKDHSNEYVGGFGVGSKSALAVASSFTVISVKDGKRNILVFSLGEQGPEGGLMDEENTNEPNGTKVIIPTSETYKFQEAVDKGMFFAYQPGTIKVNGEEQSSIYNDEKYTPVYDEDGTTLLAWHNTSGHGRGSAYLTSAFVGPVRYQIEWDKLGDIYPHALRSGYLSEMILVLPNGEVEIPRSRENLVYDKRTKATISSVVDRLVAQGKKLYETQVESAATPKLAYQAMCNAQDNGFLGEYTYKGKTIEVTVTAGSQVGNERVTTSLISKDWQSIVRNDRGTSTLFSLAQPRDLRTVAFSSSTTLVVEAGGRAESGSQHGRHILSGLANLHARSCAERDNAKVSGRRYYFVSLKQSELDPWWVSLFDEVQTGEAFKAEAVEYRRKLAREARSGYTPASAPEKDDVRVFNFVSVRALNYTVQKLGTLDTSKTYILLQAGKDAFTDKVIRTLTTHVGYREEPYLHEALMNFLNTGRVTVLLATKTWKTDKWTSVLPNWTTLKVAYQEWADTLITQSQDPMLDVAQSDLAANSYVWARSIPLHKADQIERIETRNWVKALHTVKTNRDVNEKISLARRVHLLTPSSVITQGATSLTSPGARYPLLAGHYSVGNSDAAIEYMNLLDAKLGH